MVSPALPETLMEPKLPTVVPSTLAPKSTARKLPESTVSPTAEAPEAISSPCTMAPCWSVTPSMTAGPDVGLRTPEEKTSPETMPPLLTVTSLTVPL